MQGYIKHLAVLVNDDPNGRQLMQNAWQASGCQASLQIVSDSDGLMDYLLNCGVYLASTNKLCPDLILLEMEMAQKNDFELLKTLKHDPMLRHIPVVILAISKGSAKAQRAYELGASAIVIKPLGFSNFVQMVGLLNRYWFTIATLPRFPSTEVEE